MSNIRHLRALQAFDAAAARLTLSKAAEDLGVTHGAVSRQIKQLEEYLGVALLRRRSSGVELTDAGARLHLATRQAFASLEDAIGAAKRARKRRSITISLSSSLAIKWLVPKLPEFRARHPGFPIYLDTDDEVVDFSDSDVDVALRYAGSQSRDLYCEHLMDERLVVAAAPALVPAGETPPAAIAELPLLHDRFHPHWDRWAKEAGLRGPSVQARSTALPDSAVLIAAAIDQQGAILVREILVADDLKAGRLVALSDARIHLGRALHLVCRKGDQHTLPISTLRSWLVDACSRQ